MAFFPFSIFSPSRNITLFIHGTSPEAQARFSICLNAMAHSDEVVEQAAFADLPNRILTMAGGEFCVNASRAFGVLIHSSSEHSRRKSGHYEIAVSGSEAPVGVNVEADGNEWRATASFHFNGDSQPATNTAEHLVKLPGISHLLIKKHHFPDIGKIPALADAIALKHGLSNLAHGIVWWRQTGENLEIRPYVTVPEAGTAMLESACGSASLALAAAMFHGQIVPVVQPCGETLLAGVKNGIASVGGGVKHIKSGKIWLNV